jgi:hypothetical protein
MDRLWIRQFFFQLEDLAAITMVILRKWLAERI